LGSRRKRGVMERGVMEWVGEEMRAVEGIEDVF
jgi:hypothetical protein